MNSLSAEKANHVTTVELERRQHVATVRFLGDGSPALLSSKVLGDLTVIIDQIEDDPNIRFVVFRGEGDVFNAGEDLSEFLPMDEDQAYALSKHGMHVLDAIENLPQITFAAMNGHALGGGCELALACSFRLMVAGTTIGQPEVKFGITPAWGATKRLPMVVPLNWALRMLYSGEPVTAEQAHEIGLVDEVVATPAELDAALERWFHKFGQCAPRAIIRIKRAILSKDDATHQFALGFRGSDAKEGIQAFLEKRKPSWAVEHENTQDGGPAQG